MRGVFWALVILTLAVSGAGVGLSDVAKADPQNLAGGVMIMHHPAAMVYSSDPPPEGWCGSYSTNFAITAAVDQVNRTNVVGDYVFFFVISAWGEAKEFCGVEFGLGGYSELGIAIDGASSAACGDGFTPLEIPNGAWPDPNTGIALATPGTPWTGNYVPVYCFVGYTYDPGTVIQLTQNVTESPFAGWANCGTPPVPAAATCLGAFGILQDGVFCEPPTDIQGACCFGGGVCQIMLQDECDTAGGTWDGSSVCSDPNPCPVTWACCTHDEQTGADDCQDLIQSECTAQGGVWHSGQACATYTCPTIRACCIDQYCRLTSESDCETVYQGTWNSGEFTCSPNPCLYIRACCLSDTDCQLTTEEECDGLGGAWYLNEEACAPNGDCPVISPAEPATWGSIKAIYR
jgi:hypothetical protein